MNEGQPADISRHTLHDAGWGCCSVQGVTGADLMVWPLFGCKARCTPGCKVGCVSAMVFAASLFLFYATRIKALR